MKVERVDGCKRTMKNELGECGGICKEEEGEKRAIPRNLCDIIEQQSREVPCIVP
jgi:hypothetical protein